MSRKLFLEMTRQGRDKRIKREIGADDIRDLSCEPAKFMHLPVQNVISKDLDDYNRIANYERVEREYTYNDTNIGLNHLAVKAQETSEFSTVDQVMNIVPYVYEPNSDDDCETALSVHDAVTDSWKNTDKESIAICENENITESLRNWAIRNRLSHVALTEILGILRSHKCFVLPSDARTLLKTPVDVAVRSVEPGQYSHIGLEFNLRKLSEKILGNINSVELLIGIGLF